MQQQQQKKKYPSGVEKKKKGLEGKSAQDNVRHFLMMQINMNLIELKEKFYKIEILNLAPQLASNGPASYH